MSENKKEFIEALSNALKTDDRSALKSIEYSTNVWVDDVLYGEVLYEEVIKVSFESGAFKLINATANSNGANAQEVIKAVYGEPIGLIFSGFDDIEPSDNCPQDDIEPSDNCPFCGPEEE